MNLRVFKKSFCFILVLIALIYFYFSDDNRIYGQPMFLIEDDEVWQLEFDWDGKNIGKQLTDDGFEKSLLEISPDKEKISYYKDLYSRPVYQDKDSYFKNYVALMIYNLGTREEKEIFRGDSFTSDYRWIDNNTIRVYRLAGTGVRGYKDINVNVLEPFVVAEHSGLESWTGEFWDNKKEVWKSLDFN